MKFQYSLIIIGLLSFCLYFPGLSQSYVDLAQQFSQREITGSARMQGRGGVSSSLGGDVTSAIKNPAGLGFFNRSELSFSPSIGFHNTNAKYLGRNSDDFKTNFNFVHLGVVLNNTKQNPEGAWRGGSFGISMNRINDFHSQIRYSGRNSENDLVSAVLNEANQIGIPENADPSDFLFDNKYFLPYLAYDTYLIDAYEEDFWKFDSQIDFPTEDHPVHQSGSAAVKGARYVTNFSYGGNFADKFYFGLGIGISTINYEIRRTYTEIPSETVLNYLSLIDFRQINGSGFNTNLGVIYRPTSFLTIGLSYTSPTYYSIEDAGTTDMTTRFF